MTCGVYLIRNKMDGKKYIGSSKNIESRWKLHLAGKTNCHLARAQAKYGIENFEYSVLEECPEKDRLKKELA